MLEWKKKCFNNLSKMIFIFILILFYFYQIYFLKFLWRFFIIYLLKMTRIPLKWKIYLTTFLTYSCIHSIRTCWSSLKPQLNKEPFNFSQDELGSLDMIALFALAFCINIFGGFVERFSFRKLLFGTMIAMIIDLLILAFLMIAKVSFQGVYWIFYALIGAFSCLGWPACLYVLSQYFDKSETLSLSMWNAVSQFGDFIGFFVTELTLQMLQVNGAYSLLFIALLLLLMLIVDFFHLYSRPSTEKEQKNSTAKIPQERVPTERNLQCAQQKKNMQMEGLSAGLCEGKYKVQGAINDPAKILAKIASQESQLPPHSAQPLPQQSSESVNCLTVWLLPGVACPVLAYSIVKSINTIVVSWSVVYLYQIGIEGWSRPITLLWPIFIVLGGFIGAKLNASLSYRRFMLALSAGAFLFLVLALIHQKENQPYIIVSLVISAIVIGGPYNQMSTAVPVMLGNNEKIKCIPGAKASIISLMEGFGQFMCAISTFLVPQIKVRNLYWLSLAYCAIALFLLLLQQLRSYFSNARLNRKGKNEASVKLQEEKN